MLMALLRNKLGRVLGPGSLEDESEEGASVRDVARRSEDALTATVFERLLFLPPDRAAALVQSVVDGPARLFGLDYPRGVHFWPGLSGPSGRVEPDLVLEFDDRIVVVEVKWNAAHDAGQWLRELHASHIRYRDERPLHLVLVGRRARQGETARRDAVAKAFEQGRRRRAVCGWMAWDDLFDAVQRTLTEEQPPWERAVLRDVSAALADRGLRLESTFESLPLAALTTTPDGFLRSWPWRIPDAASPETARRAFLPMVSSPIETDAERLLEAWRL